MMQKEAVALDDITTTYSRHFQMMSAICSGVLS